MSKVINIEDNNYGFDRNKLIGALALKYTSPIVSVPFIAKNESESVIYELCKRTNLETHDDEIYINGDLITVDMQKSLIIDELVNLAEEDLNNDNNDLYFGSTTIYRLRMTISRDNNRIVFYNQGDGAKVLKDHYEKEQGLYNRWIHVKVDIRPYAPEANDASCDANYSQVYITFDNDTVIEEKVGPYSKTTLSTGLLALDGLANSMIMNGESTTCWAKPIYIDNVKMSGLVTK